MSKAWPPPYTDIIRWRAIQLDMMRRDKEYLAKCLAEFKTRPAEYFISRWVDTYDPRAGAFGGTVRMPFVLFPKQVELTQFLDTCARTQRNGLIEKSRDMGATWDCAAYCVKEWRFGDGTAIGWGSRKAQLVDNGKGDMDSIFEKMRSIIAGLPEEFWPVGFNPDDHMTHMKIINPETGATITGESGDNIGRGGRKYMYFKDESAHYERPERIEAALADNTNVQIDISSVNGIGNVFHRRREAGFDWSPACADEDLPKARTLIFVMDWRDHPGKTQEWYDQRRRRFEDDGLLHVFRQEVDRSYSASIDGAIIPMDWIDAAVDAHRVLWKSQGIDLRRGRWCGALDVADGGGDRNAIAKREGVVLRYTDEWGERDTARTARRAVDAVEPQGRMADGIAVMYDCIGVGSGVKGEVNRLEDDKLMPDGIEFIAWDAGSAAVNPEGRVVEGDSQSMKNKDFYGNLKAQGWWSLRRRFEKTFNAVTKGRKYPADELISLDSRLPALYQIKKELAQPIKGKSTRLKFIVDKSPNGTKSPNVADAVMMCYFPVSAHGSYDSSLDWVDGPEDEEEAA